MNSIIRFCSGQNKYLIIVLKREYGMDREWAARKREWTGNGQQHRWNGQGMDSKREGLYREWTGNVQGDAEYVTYDATLMPVSLSCR